MADWVALPMAHGRRQGETDGTSSAKERTMSNPRMAHRPDADSDSFRPEARPTMADRHLHPNRARATSRALLAAVLVIIVLLAIFAIL